MEHFPIEKYANKIDGTKSIEEWTESNNHYTPIKSFVDCTKRSQWEHVNKLYKNKITPKRKKKKWTNTPTHPCKYNIKLKGEKKKRQKKSIELLIIITLIVIWLNNCARLYAYFAVDLIRNAMTTDTHISERHIGFFTWKIYSCLQPYGLCSF